MMRHKIQQQQTSPRQKASKDIRRAQHPHFLPKKKIIATLELGLTWKGLALMGNDAIWATLLDYGGHTMMMAGLYPLSQFLLYQAVVGILC